MLAAAAWAAVECAYAGSNGYWEFGDLPPLPPWPGEADLAKLGLVVGYPRVYSAPSAGPAQYGRITAVTPTSYVLD